VQHVHETPGHVAEQIRIAREKDGMHARHHEHAGPDGGQAGDKDRPVIEPARTDAPIGTPCGPRSNKCSPAGKRRGRSGPRCGCVRLLTMVATRGRNPLRTGLLARLGWCGGLACVFATWRILIGAFPPGGFNGLRLHGGEFSV
jgi:hypothetical protein